MSFVRFINSATEQAAANKALARQGAQGKKAVMQYQKFHEASEPMLLML